MSRKFNATLWICMMAGWLAIDHAIAQPLELTYLRASNVDLSNPHDLKLSPDGRYLYVADVGNNRVAILNPNTLELIASFGADHQSGTHDIDFDSHGRVYVADTHNNRITVYDISGEGPRLSATLVGQLSERIRGPEGVLIHPNGRIYVAGAWSNNVVAYEDDHVVGEMKGLASPHDLELTPEGNIWLADAGNDRMLLLTPELTILKELNGEPYNFNGVRYQDVLPDGTLIAADKYNHAIKIISDQGKLLTVVGTNGKSGKGSGKFKTPEGVETKGTTIWFADSGNDRVVMYSITR